MDYQLFLAWLENDRHMASRSARDVVSRLKRAVNILNESAIDASAVSKLENAPEFANCSMFIKSQLRRSITLYLEFSGNSIG